MTLEQHKQSISVAYQLFAELILGPFDQNTLNKITLIPELKDCFESCYGTIVDLKDPVSELAADHYKIFGLQVFPFEGCFLSKKDISGSDLAEQISEIYLQCGFKSPKLSSERPDHLGIELLFLGYLISIELNHSDFAKTVNAKKAQAKFMSDHLLQWLYPIKLAVSHHQSSFFNSVLDMISQTLMEHWSLVETQLSQPESEDQSSQENSNKQINIDEFLENPKTGLGSISRFLLNPAKSGFFLSRDAIVKLGGDVNVPSSFGSRESSLKALFENAVDYEKLDQVFAQIEKTTMTWVSDFSDAPEQYQSFLEPWILRAKTTRNIVDKIQTSIRENG